MCHVVYGSGAGLVPRTDEKLSGRVVEPRVSCGVWRRFQKKSGLGVFAEAGVSRDLSLPLAASGCLWDGPSRCPSEDGAPGTLLLIPPGIRTWASDLVPSLSLKSLSSLSPQGVPAPVKRRDAAGGNTHAPTARIEKRAVGGRKVVGSERERPLMASAALPFDGNADEVSVFCPTSVIVFDVFDAQQVLEHEPGVAGAFADAAIGDGGLGGRDTQ